MTHRSGDSKVTVATLSQLFMDAAAKYASQPALRYKRANQWKDITYEELASRVQEFALGLLSLGLDRGDRVAIFSKNNPEWAITDWAAVVHGFVTVPIYDTLTAEKAAYILKDSGARLIVVQTKDHLNKVRTIRKSCPALRHVIIIEEIFEKSLEPGEHLFDEVYKMGHASAAKSKGELDKLRAKVQPDDLASIVYTSGTTGEPKGAMLTQNNFASNVTSALSCVPIRPGNVALSFLPLSHVFERMGGHFTMIHAGGTIAYAESIEKVPENMGEVKPTLMFSVPRLYEKLYARVQEKVRGDSFLKRYIFHKAIEVGKRHTNEKYTLKVVNPSTAKKFKRFDHLVYHKLKDRVGGRLEFFVSGGAPLSKEIEEFFHAVNLPILQGYGLTETSPVIAVNSFTNLRLGSVGKPLPGVEVKIGEDGEILCRGPNVMQGYYKKQDATKEAFTRDGWFKTGDIGRLDEDGFLYVTDRKKELIVMSNGKKVAPQPIENELKTKPGVGMAVLIGDDRQYISVLISPDFDALKKIAQERRVNHSKPQDLITKPEILAHYQQQVDIVNQTLSQYERIKRFRILPQELTQDDGELTPTLKVKRRVVSEKYKDLIQSLYAEEKPKTL